MTEHATQSREPAQRKEANGVKEQLNGGVDPLVRSLPGVTGPPEVRPRRLHALVEACFRRPGLLILVVLPGLLLTALAVWMMPRRYQALMELSLQPVVSSVEAGGGNAMPRPVTEQEVHSAAELLRSREVLRGALDRLHGNGQPSAAYEQALEQVRRRFRVEPVPQTDVLAMRYTDSSPQRAEQALEALANSFVDQQLAMLRPESGRAIREAAVAQQRARLQAAQESLAVLRKGASGQHTESTRTTEERSAEMANLQHAAAEAQHALDLAAQQRDQAALDDALRRDHLLNVAANAHPFASGAPVQPVPAVLWPLGAGLSVLAGIVCCGWAERRSDTVATPAELDALTGTVTLAVIPLQGVQSRGSSPVRIVPEGAPPGRYETGRREGFAANEAAAGRGKR